MNDAILSWLQDWFVKKSGRRATDIAALLDADYIQAGLIDSFNIIELIADTEARFGIRFTAEQFQDRRFTTLSGLCQIIAETRATHP